MALFIVLTAILSTASFVTLQRPTLDNMYNSVHCLVFVVVFIFLATKVVEDVFLVRNPSKFLSPDSIYRLLIVLKGKLCGVYCTELESSPHYPLSSRWSMSRSFPS